MLKRLFRDPRVRSMLVSLTAAYMRLVATSTRWTIHGEAAVRELVAAGGPLIFCFWHGRMMMPYASFRWRSRARVLISLHRDGRFIAEAIEKIGLGVIDGSTGETGAAAVREIVKVVKEGTLVVITPDGPRGPRMRVAPGAIVLAKFAGATIIPVSCSVTRAIEANSWDRFMIPLPFGRGSFRYGEPMVIPRVADPATIESYRAEFERRLNGVTAAADCDCGRATPPPA